MNTMYRACPGRVRLYLVAATVVWLGAMCTVPSVVHAASSSLDVAIQSPTPNAFDYFGNSVAAAAGGRVVVGAPSHDAGAIVNAGSAYVFSSAGALLVTITNPAPTYNAWFGTSVAGAGADRLLVGAHRNDSGATDAGAVYVFDLAGVLQASITNPAPEANDYFGYCVAGLGTNSLIVGVPFDDTDLPDVGSVYCFNLHGVLTAVITNPAPAVNDYFGNSVAAVGDDKIIVGAYGKDTGGANAGIVYVFNNTGVLLATITNPAPSVDDDFGYCVAGLGTNYVIVGAYKDDTGAVNGGVVYVFDTDGKLMATLRNPDPEANDWFGVSVAGFGSDRILVGAQQDNTGAPDAGIAYLFDVRGVLLATVRNPRPQTSDSFGCSVAGVGSEKVLIGAYLADRGAQDAGATYLFKINPSLLTDYNGDGIADLAVYHTISNTWHIMDVQSNVIRSALQWGYSDVVPVSGDYDGDSVADFAVFRNVTGYWHILGGTNKLIAWELNWGYPGVVPVPGDYDGDAVCDLAVFDDRTGNWYIHSIQKGELLWAVNWGYPGVVPVPGDYDGDGASDLAVFDTRTGNWHVLSIEKGEVAVGLNWGYPGVMPVPGDYDGDGRYDLAVYDPRPGAWYILGPVDGPVSQIALGVMWGGRNRMPVGASW